MNEAGYSNLVDNVEDLIIEDEVSRLSAQTQPSQLSFKSLPTTTLAIFYLFIAIAVIPLCFVLPNIVAKHPSQQYVFAVIAIDFTATSIIIYINVGLWLLALLISGILKLLHWRHKLYGYILLHKKLNILKYVPFLAFSAGNVALLLYSLWVIKSTDQTINNDDKLKYAILQVIVCVQCGIAVLSQFVYLYFVIQFNLSNAPPDIYNEILLSSTPMLYSSNLMDILTIRSQKQQNQTYMSLCETQNDVIEYLKNRCTVLETRIAEFGQIRDRVNSHA